MSRSRSSPASRSASPVRTRVTGSPPPPSTRSIGPLARITPFAITTTSSTLCSTSESRWLDTSTARPRPAWARSRSRTQRMPGGSSPLVGSSRISTSGSPSSAAAIASRWRMPIE